MNRREFITRYNQVVRELGCRKNSVIVASGGALLMLGLRETTDDLDLDVPKHIFTKFKRLDNTEIFDGKEIVNLDDDVSLHVLEHDTEITVIDNVYLYSVKELIKFKKRLIANPERKKDKIDQDKKDLEALEKMLNKVPASFRW